MVIIMSLVLGAQTSVSLNMSQEQWHAVSLYPFSQYDLKCQLSDVY